MNKYFKIFKKYSKNILRTIGLLNKFQKIISIYKQIPRPDDDFESKFINLIQQNDNFGESDFASLCPGLFRSSLSNHGTIHQRIDEASLLWMMVKKSNGKILAGGSTILLLGASGNRNVVSIDRDPRQLTIANKVFNKLDVKKRIKLYNQSSRKNINIDTYGFLFVDGDHSYDGVCFDIARYWNQLENSSKIPSIAVFHDAQKNPVTYVEPVERALNELLRENAAERITSWGAQLAVKKIKDIDTKKWHQKIDEEFWINQNSYLYNNQLNPVIKNFSLTENKKENYFNNILGFNNLDEEPWKKINLSVNKLDLTADSPVRYIKLINPSLKSELSRDIPFLKSKFTFEIFLRPKNIDSFRLVLDDQKNENYFDISNIINKDHPKIENIQNNKQIRVLDVKFDYLNAFFHCYYHFETTKEISNSKLRLIIDENLENKNKGFFVNFFSLDQS